MYFQNLVSKRVINEYRRDSYFVELSNKVHFQYSGISEHSEKKLDVNKRIGGKVCLGYQHYADHVYQYGFDFAVKYKNNPSFGLFWTKSFSHEDLSMSSAMDTRVVHYLKELKTLHTRLVNRVFFQWSWHEIRSSKKSLHWWIEERLPFFYISLPEKFQKAHPEIVKNLKINMSWLSSPYDVHLMMIRRHILKMSGGYEDGYKPTALKKLTRNQSLWHRLWILSLKASTLISRCIRNVLNCICTESTQLATQHISR